MKKMKDRIFVSLHNLLQYLPTSEKKWNMVLIKKRLLFYLLFGWVDENQEVDINHHHSKKQDKNLMIEVIRNNMFDVYYLD